MLKCWRKDAPLLPFWWVTMAEQMYREESVGPQSPHHINHSSNTDVRFYSSL